MKAKAIFALMAAAWLALLAGPVSAQSQRWSCYLTNADVNSSPAISIFGITIYVGAGNKLYAVKDDGTKRWAFPAGGTVNSSPAISKDGTIYVGANDGKLYAINAAGNKKWDYTCPAAEVHSSPAIGQDGTIYFTDTMRVLYALTPGGSLKWTLNGVGDSSPAIDRQGIIYASHCAVRPDGTVKWVFAPAGWGVKGPILGKDGTVYLATNDGKVYGVNPDGTQKWVCTTASYFDSSPALSPAGLTLYVGCGDGYLYALNTANGIPRWVYNAHNAVHSSPAVGADGTIYVGSLRAINEDGTEKWVFNTGSSSLRSSPAVVKYEGEKQGTIYIGGFGSLYAISCDSLGLATDSNWPMFRQNLQHTGRLGAYPPSMAYVIALLLLLAD